MIVLTDDEWEEQRAVLIPQFTELITEPSSPEDLAPKILEIVKEYPTSACAKGLADAIFASTHSTPALTDAIIQALVIIMPEFTDLKIDYSGQVLSFSFAVKVGLMELLKGALFEAQFDRSRTTVGPTNPTLTAALVTGSILKHKMMRDSGPYQFAYEGLHLPNHSRPKKKREEAMAVGVCLQLAVAGSAMMEEDLEKGFGKDVIVDALKALKENGVVKDEKGVELLDDTIENAENGFVRVYTVAEVWGKLFPN